MKRFHNLPMAGLLAGLLAVAGVAPTAASEVVTLSPVVTELLQAEGFLEAAVFLTAGLPESGPGPDDRAALARIYPACRALLAGEAQGRVAAAMEDAGYADLAARLRTGPATNAAPMDPLYPSDFDFAGGNQSNTFGCVRLIDGHPARWARPALWTGELQPGMAAGCEFQPSAVTLTPEFTSMVRSDFELDDAEVTGEVRVDEKEIFLILRSDVIVKFRLGRVREGGGSLTVKYGFDNLRSASVFSEVPELEAGRWYGFRARLQGRGLTVDFDGENVLDVLVARDSRLSGSRMAASGRFGWGSNDGAGSFRNLELKALSPWGRRALPRLTPVVRQVPDGAAIRMLEGKPEGFVSLVHDKIEPFNAQKHSLSNGVLTLKGAAYFQLSRKDLAADHFRATGKVKLVRTGSVWFRVNGGLLFGVRCGEGVSPLVAKHTTMNFNSVDAEQSGPELKPGRDHDWELEYHEPVGVFRLDGKLALTVASTPGEGKGKGPNRLGISSYNTEAEVRDVLVQKLKRDAGEMALARAGQAKAYIAAARQALDRAKRQLQSDIRPGTWPGTAAARAILDGSAPALAATSAEALDVAARLRQEMDWATSLELLEANANRFAADSDGRRTAEAEWKKIQSEYRDAIQAVAIGELGPDGIIRVGSRPGPVFPAGDGRHVWVTIPQSKEAVRFDPRTGKTVSRLALSGEPWLAAGRGGYMLCVFAGDRGVLHKVDLETGQSLGSVKLPKGELLDLALHPGRPQAFLAIDENIRENVRKDTLDFTLCRIHRLDEATLELAATEGIGRFLAVDPLGRYLYAGFHLMLRRGLDLEPGFLRVQPVGPMVDHLVRYRMSPTGLAVDDQRPVPGLGGRGLAVSPDGATLCYVGERGYLDFQKKKMESGGVAVWKSTDLGRMLGAFEAGSPPTAMEFSPDGTEAYVLTAGQGRRHRTVDFGFKSAFALPPEMSKGTVTALLPLPDGAGLMAVFAGRPAGVYVRRFASASGPAGGAPAGAVDEVRRLLEAAGRTLDEGKDEARSEAFAESLRRLVSRPGYTAGGEQAARWLLTRVPGRAAEPAGPAGLPGVKIEEREEPVRLDALPPLKPAPTPASADSPAVPDAAEVDRIERLKSLKPLAEEFPYSWLWECNQALDRFPASAVLRIEAADGWLKTGRPEAAIALLGGVAREEAAPVRERVRACLRLAGVHAGRDEATLELAALEYAAGVLPGEAGVHRRLAGAWKAAGCPRRAQFHQMVSWHVFPSQPDFRRELAGAGVLPAESPQKLDVPTLFGRVSRAVVVIVREEGNGTGFLVARNGRILTNQHVVEGATNLTVKFRDAEGLEQARPARRIGGDSLRDIALLAIDPLPADVAPLELADSDAVAIGEPIVAIGNPGMGARILTNTATEGILSGRNRMVGNCALLQISAAVNPGNSGGPLLDRFGRVVGMVTAKSHLENVGFAVPANELRAFVLAQDEMP